MWPSAIFVPRLEFCDKIIGLLGSPFGKIPWGGLVMSNKFHLDPSLRPPEKNDQVKKIAFLRLLKTRNLKALFTIDELLYDYVKNAFEKESRNFYYVGDPVDMDGDCSRLAARKRFKIPIDAKVIIVYGALHDRKGVLELLYASQIPNFPLDVSIFLAGKQSEDLREKIEASDAAKKLKAANRLFIADRFIDDEEEYAAFKASDLVWIGYNHFYGMSGVMIQGSKMKLPLVVCKSGLISWMTSKYNIGLAVDPSSGEDVSRAISEILSNKRLYEELGSNGYELSMRHTSKKFGNDIIDAILK
jgi:glycosyltransferase involved in cell wall biosynthesis